jgi:succinyl-CoA synthetase beta subunit
MTSMDAKFGFDDNADFRQKDIFKLRDTTQEDPQEVEAAEVCLSQYPFSSSTES